MNEGQTPRQNSKGHPCPPWCAIDHSRFEACVGGGGGIGHIWSRAVRTRDGFTVIVHGALEDPAADWPSLELGLRDAEHLAAIVGLLAGATPDQHCELAAAIRKAAADITSTDGAQS